jgi:hypothetical protein
MTHSDDEPSGGYALWCKSSCEWNFIMRIFVKRGLIENVYLLRGYSVKSWLIFVGLTMSNGRPACWRSNKGMEVLSVVSGQVRDLVHAVRRLTSGTSSPNVSVLSAAEGIYGSSISWSWDTDLLPPHAATYQRAPRHIVFDTDMGSSEVTIGPAWDRVLENLIGRPARQEITFYKEYEALLSCSQQPTTGPYPEPHKSILTSSYPLCLTCILTFLAVYACVSQVVSSLQGFRLVILYAFIISHASYISHPFRLFFFFVTQYLAKSTEYEAPHYTFLFSLLVFVCSVLCILFWNIVFRLHFSSLIDYISTTHRADQCTSNALDLYFGGTRFESRQC